MVVTCSDTRHGLFWKGCNIGQSGSLVEAISKGGVHGMYFYYWAASPSLKRDLGGASLCLPQMMMSVL